MGEETQISQYIGCKGALVFWVDKEKGQWVILTQKHEEQGYITIYFVDRLIDSRGYYGLAIDGISWEGHHE